MKLNKYTILHTIYALFLLIMAYRLQSHIPIWLAYGFMFVGSLLYWLGEGKTEWYTWVGNVSTNKGILPQDLYHNWRIVEQGGTGLFIYGLLIAKASFVVAFGLYLLPYPVYLWQVKREKRL